MHQAGGDAAEHRLALFLSDVLGQLHELVRHAVERVAELLELVLRVDRHALVECPSPTAAVPRISAKIGRTNERPQR